MQLSRRPDPADQALYVEFHDQAVLDPVASKEAGTKQWKDVPYIRITVDPFTVIDGPIRDSDEYSDIRRFPDSWELYQSKKTGERIGTPLKNLTGMTPAKIKNYEFADIYSIEQLAAQSDQVLSKIMGGLADRKLAKEHMVKAAEDYQASELAKKFEAVQVQLDAQKAALEEKDKLIAEMLAKQKEPKKLKGNKDEE